MAEAAWMYQQHCTEIEHWPLIHNSYSFMAFNNDHSYPPTVLAGPDAESLEFLAHISTAAIGPDPQAQILAIVNRLLDVRLSHHNQTLEQAHYRELNARDEAWGERVEEAREQELALQAELATLQERLDQPRCVLLELLITA